MWDENNKKYIDSSNGLLTGCLNLIIDKAPTIPNESAIFPDITVVITRPIRGRIQYVVTFENDLAQDCSEIIKEKFINAPNPTEKRHLIINKKVISPNRNERNLSIIY